MQPRHYQTVRDITTIIQQKTKDENGKNRYTKHQISVCLNAFLKHLHYMIHHSNRIMSVEDVNNKEFNRVIMNNLGTFFIKHKIKPQNKDGRI